MMYKYAYFALALLAGLLCYYVAKQRKLAQPGLWFVAGTFFHIFAVAAVMYVAKYVTDKKKGYYHEKSR